MVSALSGITGPTVCKNGTKAADGDEVYKKTSEPIEHRHFGRAIKQLPVAHQSQLLSLGEKINQ